MIMKFRFWMDNARKIALPQSALPRITSIVLAISAGSRSLCVGYGTEKCKDCGFCMAGEMSSVFHFCPDTILSGFKLRM